MNLLIWLIVGAVAGWAAGEIVRGFGFGLLGNIVVGIIGAMMGGAAFDALGIAIGASWVGALITATVGAVLLLVIVGFVRKLAA